MKAEQKRVRIILGSATAALLLILAVPSNKKTSDPEVSAATPVPAGAAVPPAATEAQGRRPRITAEQLAEQRARSESLVWSRDPFRRGTGGPIASPVAVASESQPGTPRLTGISIFERKRMAIVDRQVVREGDRLHSGHTVAKITAETVTLSLHEEQLTLTLGANP
jgi:hypothetical protein